MRPGTLERIALIAALLALHACTPGTQRAFERPERVFLITLDTVRLDHLSFHGYPRETTPFLAMLAERSADFETALSTSSHTNPAHTSIFTGLHLPQHKLLFNEQAGFSASIHTLTQAYQDAGYRTSAFVSVPFLDVLKRGFDVFDTTRGLSPYVNAETIVDRALESLQGPSGRENAFVWLHFYDAHIPYQAPNEWTQRMQAKDADEERELLQYWTGQQFKIPVTDRREEKILLNNQAYDAELAYVDDQLKRLYEEVDRLGLLPGSLWVILSDHGEGLGSHRYLGHGRHIFQEQLRIPLLIHHPDGGLVTGRIKDVVTQVDLYPTLLDVIGAAADDQVVPLHGASLLPLLEGKVNRLPERTAFAQRRKKFAHRASRKWEDGPIYALQDDRHKYVFHASGNDEFFDLARDPHELENLAGGGTEAEVAWRERTRGFYSRLSAESEAVDELGLSEIHLEALRALGYID